MSPAHMYCTCHVCPDQVLPVITTYQSSIEAAGGHHSRNQPHVPHSSLNPTLPPSPRPPTAECLTRRKALRRSVSHHHDLGGLFASYAMAAYEVTVHTGHELHLALNHASKEGNGAEHCAHKHTTAYE